MMEKHFSETHSQTEHSDSNRFDPDKRVEMRQSDFQSKAESFDPDKRVESETKAIESQDTIKTESDHESTEKLYNDYIQDLKDRSPYPDTIPDKPFSPSDIRITSPEELKDKREIFNKNRQEIREEWEARNQREWPRYKEAALSDSGTVIRPAGAYYDAHHIQPLSMGGDNKASNITPMHVNDHFDSKGVHAPDSPCEKMKQSVGGKIQ